jgi:hypothetical protein
MPMNVTTTGFAGLVGLRRAAAGVIMVTDVTSWLTGPPDLALPHTGLRMR